MNKQELITIIVPIYNTEKFLERCLKSIKEQTYTYFECLLIDDGSVDNSGDICEHFVSTDNRFRYIKKDNGGVSSARNLGLEMASGEYICFIDSDDFADSNMLNYLYDTLKLYNADFIQSNIINGISENTANHPAKETLLTDSKILDEALASNGAISPYITPCLFVAGLAQKVAFDEKLKYGEDFLFLIEYLSNCTTVIHTSSKLYHYMPNDQSATRDVQKNTLGKVKCTLESLEKALEFCSTKNHEHLIHERVFVGIESWLFFQLANKVLFKRNNEINQYLFNKLNTNFKYYTDNPFILGTRKFCLKLRSMAPYLLAIRFAIHQVIKKVRR